MMQRPIRLRILDELTRALEEITVSNGYQHDLANRVFRGRTVFGEGDPLPMISILEPPLPIDQMPNPATSETSSLMWELMIQGFTDDDRKNPTDPAYFLIADVKRRLAQERRRTNERPIGGAGGILDMGGAVTRLDIGPGVVRPPDEVSSRAYFWMIITLNIVEDMSDPFV